MKYCILSLFILLSMTVSAQSPIGMWKSVDENSGEVRSHVEIYEQGGNIFGKITKLLDADPNAKCDQCSGSKKNKPIVGLVIIEDLKPYKDYWRKGQILDPENGKEYTCELWLEDGNLKIKGKHWTGFYRTQTWYPIK
ncbi:MAG: DUF2147 domain-containing protein [Bacteroidota bacterium]